MKTLLENIYQSTLKGNENNVRQGVQDAIDRDINPQVILQEGLIAPMKEVGQLYEDGEYFVPEMLISAKTMKSGLDLLRPHLIEADVKSIGTVVIGTVKGDLHDIGKTLVSMMLEGANFEVYDLGADVAPDKFVEKIEEVSPDIVGMSALLTTTLPSMQTTIQTIRKTKNGKKVKIMIGGAPVTQEYAEKIGADGYATNASQATSVAKMLIDT